MSFTMIVTLPDGLRRYQKLVDMGGMHGADFQAKRQTALQFLNWCNEGSPNEPVVPPIDTGNLRGSASVFVGAVMVMNTRGKYENGTPLESYKGGADEIAIIYNTAYAARLHETTWLPGGRNPSKAKLAKSLANSAMFGGVGNKWVERHMAADGAALLEMYALTLKRLTGA